MGAFSGARDPEFVRWCRNFLLKQLRLIQPRLIFTLGVHVPGFLASLSPELQSSWSDVTRLRTLDERGVALVYPSTFSGVLLPTAVVALTPYKYRFFTSVRGHVPALGVFVVFDVPFPCAFSSCSQLKAWAVSEAQ